MGFGESRFGALDSLLEVEEILLGLAGAVFPTLAAEGKIACVDLLFVEQAFARAGFGLPLVATADEFGDENARGGEEVDGGGRLVWIVHVSILVLVR